MVIKFVFQGGGRGDGLGPPGPRLDRKESYKAQRKNYRFPMMLLMEMRDFMLIFDPNPNICLYKCAKNHLLALKFICEIHPEWTSWKFIQT